MIISAFSDGEKKDKIAEFYDTTFPCAFMKGLLAESQEQEKDIQITFSVRHKFKKTNNFYSEEFIKKANTVIFNEEDTQLINEAYDKCEKFYGEDL